MSIGQIIRIIEIIVTIYCGMKLAVRPGEMRWNHKAAKAVFCLCVFVITALDIMNSFIFKFSSIGLLVTIFMIFIVLHIFYTTYCLQLLVQFFIYWYTVLLLNYIFICASCIQQTVFIREYIRESYGLEWHWLHVTGMLITIVGSLSFLKAKKESPLIICKFKRTYVFIALVLMIAIVIGEILFNQKITTDVLSRNYFIISILMVWMLFSMLLIILVFKNYKDSKHQNLISEMNFQMLQKQYVLLQDMYALKRRQVHDSVNHDIIVMGYLRDKNYGMALKYLEEKMEKSSAQQKCRYTGISVIDLMLDYKIGEAKKYDIQVKLDVEVYFCPIDDTEMCVLLGNLLDNAIEATCNLSPDLRRIDLSMKNPNSIFIIEMKNPFKGKRKKINGHYMTTKSDKELHGLGLDSVIKIVGKHNGYIEIKDEDQLFVVFITLFGIRSKART